MSRTDVEFKTTDQVTLRGWFYTPTASTGKVPCLIMTTGVSGTIDMNELEIFAKYFTAHLPLSCLVYDHRGFGLSDTAPGKPRQEAIPSEQRDDYSDAITYAQTLPDVDAKKIGIWGTSYSGCHVLAVAALDRRVKAVLSQIPLVDGYQTMLRQVAPNMQPMSRAMFAKDRLDRFQGKEPGKIPVVSKDGSPALLPGADEYAFMEQYMSGKSLWKNELTIRSLEMVRDNNSMLIMDRISPTPLLMTIAREDCCAPVDLSLEAYERAREPKQLQLIPGGHFDVYDEKYFESNAKTQTEFLRKWLLS